MVRKLKTYLGINLDVKYAEIIKQKLWYEPGSPSASKCRIIILLTDLYQTIREHQADGNPASW